MACKSIASAVCAVSHSLFISNEGSVFSCGHSPFGAHGHDMKLYLKVIPILKSIQYIAGSNYHSVCVDINGNVYTFGKNNYGQLGVGVDKETLRFTHIPQKVYNLPPCLQVSCGYSFTICLCEDGYLYSFGYNRNGQLGIGTNEEVYNSPQQISSLKDVEFIECGGSHSFCKTLYNEIFCWGQNGGQLGHGNTENQNIPILCSSLSNEDIVDIKCGNVHTLALTASGNVLSCGNSICGRLGRKFGSDHATKFQKIPSLSNITRIECGYDTSMCIDVNGDLYVFGDNNCGKLGLGDFESRFEPVKHPTLSNIIDISSNGECTFVKTSNNEIYAFGKNLRSQLEIEQNEEVSGLRKTLNFLKLKKNESKQAPLPHCFSPIRAFQDKEEIWCTNILQRCRAKSARKW